MRSRDVIDVLNQLLSLHARSLPLYLQNARPWSGTNHHEALEVIEAIAHDHRYLVDRIGRLILDEEGTPDAGRFPMEFTDLHDLSLEYILRRVLEYQRRDVQRIEQCVGRLAGHPLARAVAEEALGAARGHLESLEEVLAPKQPAPK